jgi:DNA oxidative demethylase
VRSTGPLPEGFLYRAGFLNAEEERALAARIANLPFAEIRMHGVTAKRRAAHYGWLYGYESWKISPGPPIPDFLLAVRERLAELTGAAPEEFAEALATEYPPGAGIGWHRDAPVFGVVAAVSLVGSCRLRFQRGKGPERQVAGLLLAPRSAYVLAGPARTDWQHGIPPTKELRYSVTFRTLRKRPA